MSAVFQRIAHAYRHSLGDKFVHPLRVSRIAAEPVMRLELALAAPEAAVISVSLFARN